MKKPQLRKIIKEEIARLQKTNITEQLPIFNPCDPDCQGTFNCKQWLAGVLQLPPFSSNNPNQPCNFIQNKINQTQNWINNFSGNPQSQQLALKQCKLTAFNYLCQQHNCPNC